MSAYICHEWHIATCAVIVKDSEIGELADVSRQDIAVELARANMLSVAWRYGPEGQVAYADMTRKLLGELAASQWEVDGDAIALAQAGSEGVLAAHLDGSPAEYLAACRWASTSSCEPEEAHAYLRCLRYQSCEPPDWKESEACRWIEAALQCQAQRMEAKLLCGRHVWQVPHPFPYTGGP